MPGPPVSGDGLVYIGGATYGSVMTATGAAEMIAMKTKRRRIAKWSSLVPNILSREASMFVDLKINIRMLVSLLKKTFLRGGVGVAEYA